MYKRQVDAVGNFASVREGDRVYNLTDGSEGRVADFESGLIIVDGLEGGMRNVFDRGDQYAIGTQEQNRFMLLVDPPVTNSNITLYDGTSDTIAPTRAGVVQEVVVTHGLLPADFTNEEVVEYTILKSDGSYASDDPRSVASSSGIRVGSNTIPFLPFQLAEHTTYQATATRENGQSLPITNVKFEAQSRDKVIVTYARMPRPLLREDSVCEFPNIYLTALYQGAANVLIEKVNESGTPQALLQRYEHEISKLREHLDMQDESGAYEIAIDQDGQYIDYLYQSQSDNHIWIR